MVLAGVIAELANYLSFGEPSQPAELQAVWREVSVHRNVWNVCFIVVFYRTMLKSKSGKHEDRRAQVGQAGADLGGLVKPNDERVAQFCGVTGATYDYSNHIFDYLSDQTLHLRVKDAIKFIQKFKRVDVAIDAFYVRFCILPLRGFEFSSVSE